MNTKTSSSAIPVIVIFAPTASGKTALTKELFSSTGSHFILNAEIISADSQAVYKYMDIGTAKPDKKLCNILPHHLIDLVTPDCQFSVADFIEIADKACKEIYERGKIPVVCGGTGFYIRNFLFGLPPTPESNEIIRQQLKTRIEKEGNEALYAELKAIDPESANKIHVNDAYRICRSLEVFYTTGKKRSEYEVLHTLREQFNFLFLILKPNKEELFNRISKRVDVMFDNGLEKEINSLIACGYNLNSPGMKAIGYHEWFLSDDKEQIKNLIIKNSCKYAKKQFTYINDISSGIVFDYSASEQNLLQIKDVIQDWYKKL